MALTVVNEAERRKHRGAREGGVLMLAQNGSLMRGLAFVLALSSCANSDDAVRYVCRAEDGRGNVYEGSDLEMLNAAEDAIQKCETTASNPTTCVARGCRGE